MKLKPNSLILLPDSHSFSQIALFGILEQSAKWGWVSLLGTSISEHHWFFSVLMKCLWPDQMLLGARSPPSSRTGLFFPISPLGWRDCRCLFWLWPILTMIYLWALVPGLTLAPVQPPAWSCKSFPLTLVGMKGTELHLARKARSRNSSGAIICAYSGFF